MSEGNFTEFCESLRQRLDQPYRAGGKIVSSTVLTVLAPDGRIESNVVIVLKAPNPVLAEIAELTAHEAIKVAFGELGRQLDVALYR